MKPLAQQRFGPTGRLILSPMLGPWDRYEPGSEQWAQAVAMHIQVDYRRLRHEGSIGYLVKAIREAVTADPPPWTVFPEEANGNPETWMRMVTGESWADVQAAVCRHDPAAWEPIAQHLARWEAKHRKRGNPNFGNPEPSDLPIASDTGNRDDESARGIRRRLQKRADAGDAQAQELINQLADGAITVNQAAIEAGMRQRYFRVPLIRDPPKVAAAIAKHFTSSELQSLCEALLSHIPSEQ